MKKLPSFRQLQYLVALQEHQHFGKAALACFVSQSTLSTGIAELEAIVGIPLLERDNKQFLITSLGLEFINRSKQLIEQASSLMDFVQSHQHPMSGQVKMACIPTIAPFVVHHILQKSNLSYPDLTLLIREETTENALNLLQEGQIDLVLLALPIENKEFFQQVLYKDPFRLVIPKSWQEKNFKEEKCQWPDGSIVLLEKEHCLSRLAIHACHITDKRLINPFRATSLYTLTQMVNQGLGVTFLPQMAISAGLLKGTQLIDTPLKNQEAYREIGVVWRKNAARLETFKVLANLIKHVLRALEPQPTPQPLARNH